MAGHIWVPMDDETTMVYNWEYSTTEPLTDEDRLERRLGNGPLDVDQTTFRSRRNRENNYLLDRRVQRTETFTGIDGVNVQDRAVQESMGRIVDRSREHLGPADRAVIQARRLLLQAIKTVEAGGTPPGVEPTYYTLRPAEAVRAARHRLADAPRPRGAAGGGAARAMIRAHLRSLAPSTAGSTYRKYASPAAFGRRLAAGPFSSL